MIAETIFARALGTPTPAERIACPDDPDLHQPVETHAEASDSLSVSVVEPMAIDVVLPAGPSADGNSSRLVSGLRATLADRQPCRSCPGPEPNR
jgi:hypothetical protein